MLVADYWERATGKRIRRSLRTSDLNEAKQLIGDLIEHQKAHRPTNSDTGETVLYVIQRGDDGPIKVGISRRLKQRIAQLQNGNAEKLQILRVYKMFDVERAIHAMLEGEARLEGEWFPAQLLSHVDRFFKVDLDTALKCARTRQKAITVKSEHLMSAGLL